MSVATIQRAESARDSTSYAEDSRPTGDATVRENYFTAGATSVAPAYARGAGGVERFSDNAAAAYAGTYDRYPRPHRAHYPHWFGEVRRFSRNGNEGYTYPGRPVEVNGLNDLIAHKHALDYARRDLMDTRPAYKRGESYRDAAMDVILAHHYLIARVYEWGSRNPYDSSIDGPLYQNMVRDLWMESLSMMVEYEQYNDNDGWLRENLFRHLFRTLKETRLDDRYRFYHNLVEDIRQAIY